MNIFFPVYEPTITKHEIDYATQAINSGWVSSLGPFIDLFEKKFAEFCGTQYAICVSNGTAGLHLALLSLGLKEGDEVILPDYTFIATANAIKYLKAEPVFVDIDRQTLCIDVNQIEKAITRKTKAIMPVHVYGHPANMIGINKIAEKHNLFVIEDCCEAHGAEISGQRVGSFGNCGVFSFYGNKVITTGEGGIICTDNLQLCKKIRMLKDHAMSKEKRYWHEEIGYNYRMTNIQAAIGLAQLERIDEIISKKKQIYKLYQKYLNVKGARLNFEQEGYKNIYWMICLEYDKFNEKDRDDFILKLRKKGIDSRPYFYPVSDMPMYKKYNANTPVVHELYKKGLNLPSYFGLKEENIKYICEVINALLN